MSDPDLQRYRLLAGAVAGFTVGVASEPDERAWTDGQTIYLPGERPEFWRDAVVAQAALLAAGSLTPSLMFKMTSRRRCRLRYLTLESARAMRVLADVAPRAVAGRVAQVYDGAIPGSPQESYERANSTAAVMEAPPWLGTIKPSRLLLNAPSVTGRAPSRDSTERASNGDPLPEHDDEEQTERSTILERLSVPSRNALAEALRKLFDAGRTPSGQDGGDVAEMRAAASRIGKAGPGARSGPDAVTPIVGLLGPPVGRAYPEWDWRAATYRPDHCTVTTFDPPVDEQPHGFDPSFDPRLRRALARLGLALERHHRQPDGDVLDLTALVDCMVDRAAGELGDDRVYELKRRTAHDLGVVVLLDATGSTDDAAHGRRVFDDQRQLAGRLIGTLEELGDRVAGYGFQSWGRGGVRFLRIKDFDDRYDLEARRRLAALRPAGFTRLGAAIRHGSHLVSQRSGVRNTLLIVVGDGLPYDDGYEGRYAQEDSRHALSEAVTAGIGCACLSVTTATDDAVLRRVWGHVPYLTLEKPDELARQVMPILRRSLREAAAMGRDGRKQDAVANRDSSTNS